jgi:1,4-dihydroxy-2-naphthoate octaprenyltransferase
MDRETQNRKTIMLLILMPAMVVAALLLSWMFNYAFTVLKISQEYEPIGEVIFFVLMGLLVQSLVNYLPKTRKPKIYRSSNP